MQTDSNDDDFQILIDRTGFEKSKLRDIINALEASGLIASLEIASKRSAHIYAFTKDGMSFAHERALRQLQLEHDER